MMAHKFPEVIEPAERRQAARDLLHLLREKHKIDRTFPSDRTWPDWAQKRYTALQWEIIGYTRAVQNLARAHWASMGQPFWSVNAFYNPASGKFGEVEKLYFGPLGYKKANELYEYLKARQERYDAVYLRQSIFTRYDTTKLISEERWETESFLIRCQANNYDEPWDDDDWQDDHDPSEFRTCETCGGEFWPGGSSCVCDSRDKTS